MRRSPVRSPSAFTAEIAGVAGSGKSTLANALSSDRSQGTLDGPLQLRNIRHLAYVAHSLPRLSRLLPGWIRGRRPSWTELKLVIYVMEWSRWLDRRPEFRTSVTYIDQGPVYALARLGHADPPLPGTQVGDAWWSAVVGQWAECLDAVIWTDAPNDVLWNRVSTRTQHHEIKGRSKAEGLAFIDCYRTSYEVVLSALEQRGGPVVFRYDTGSWSTEDIVSDLVKKLADLRSRLGSAASAEESS